jgi:ribosomal protein S18 acetylase RimI-like enzyme
VEFHRQGFATALMKSAIRFALQQRIEWIDLFVFSENVAAISLYQSLGFVEIGRCMDRFRISGRSFDDVMMTLQISLQGG